MIGEHFLYHVICHSPLVDGRRLRRFEANLARQPGLLIDYEERDIGPAMRRLLTRNFIKDRLPGPPCGDVDLLAQILIEDGPARLGVL